MHALIERIGRASDQVFFVLEEVGEMVFGTIARVPFWLLCIAVCSPFLISAAPPAAEVNTSDPLTNLIQYGVLGMVVLGFITGWIVPGPQAKQLIEENKRLNALIESRFLPMSEQYAATLERSAIVMDKATDALEVAAAALARIEPRERGKG